MTMLEKRRLFENGREVSSLCLGTMMFGDQTDEAESARILDAFFEAGGNFVDTADTYAKGDSERILGRLLKRRGDECFLATKVGNPVPEIADQGGLAPERILRAADLSLERLDRETIDLYYLHRDDGGIPLDEIITVLGRLIDEGKIRHWGFSNFRPWKIAEMVRICDNLGIARPVAAQPYYHVLNRVVETDYIPACRHFGIGVVPYSPLARGVLTGKYRGEAPEGSRGARGDARILETEFFPETIGLANRAADHAEESGRDPVGLAINWVLANDAVSSVLIGPKTLSQVEAYISAVDAEYTVADEEFLSSLCATGHTPVSGHNDPRYPIDGRRTPFGSDTDG